MSIVGLIITLALWNWLGGLVATFEPAAFVLVALNQAQADPDNIEKTRHYLRWVAGAHLFNHAVTTLGSLVICLGSIGMDVPAWAAWGIFAIYFLFMRLGHFIDAGTRLAKADAMPAASSM